MNTKFCRHYEGTIHTLCGAKINWREAHGNVLPCIGEKGDNACREYLRFTKEELLKQEQEIEEAVNRTKKMLENKKSPCCNADIDESRVIKSGRHNGHGGRYCSKCGKCLFWV
jgi:hypothetical protein